MSEAIRAASCRAILKVTQNVTCGVAPTAILAVTRAVAPTVTRAGTRSMTSGMTCGMRRAAIRRANCRVLCTAATCDVLGLRAQGRCSLASSLGRELYDMLVAVADDVTAIRSLSVDADLMLLSDGRNGH
jgi:hypothetical protein